MDIFQISTHSALLAIVVSTKVTLAGFSKFEQKYQNWNNFWTLTRFKKHMLDLQNNVLKLSTIKLLSDQENTPKHLLSSIEEFKKSPEPDIFIFHVELLNESSKALIVCISNVGVGQKTYKEIKKWFKMMEKLTTISSLWDGIENSIKSVFLGTIGIFTNLEHNDELSVKEYPLFSSNCLLIQIAYIVDYLNFDHVKNECKKHISIEDYEKWEKFSGDICEKLIFHDIKFGFDTVLSFPEEDSVDDENSEDDSDNDEDDDEQDSVEEEDDEKDNPNPNPNQVHVDDMYGEPLLIWLKLPYKFMVENMQCNNNMKSPLEVHDMVMKLMVVRITAIMTSSFNEDQKDHDVLKEVITWVDNQHKTIKERMIKLKNRDKTSSFDERERNKKRKNNPNKEYSYKPRFKGVFERDIFIMGTQSHYHLECTQAHEKKIDSNRYAAAQAYYSKQKY